MNIGLFSDDVEDYFTIDVESDDELEVVDVVINEEEEIEDSDDEEDVGSFSGESLELSSDFSGYDTMSSEEEDDDHLLPHLRFTETVSRYFRLPWNQPEESSEGEEDHQPRWPGFFSRRREEDDEEEPSAKMFCQEL